MFIGALAAAASVLAGPQTSGTSAAGEAGAVGHGRGQAHASGRHAAAVDPQAAVTPVGAGAASSGVNLLV
jgi:hypothetical protein